MIPDLAPSGANWICNSVTGVANVWPLGPRSFEFPANITNVAADRWNVNDRGTVCLGALVLSVDAVASRTFSVINGSGTALFTYTFPPSGTRAAPYYHAFGSQGVFLPGGIGMTTGDADLVVALFYRRLTT